MKHYGRQPARIGMALVLYLALAVGAAAQTPPFLAGTHDGLHSISASGKASLLWSGGEVRKIMTSSRGWYILSSAGIFSSPDLKAFAPMNEGLPFKTIKEVGPDGKKSFHTEVQDLKDLEFHPENDSIMVSCSKDDVFLSRDGGKTWKVFPSPNSTTGLKAAVVYSNPALTVIVSHPIKGLYRIQPDDAKPAWVQMNEGLPRIPGTTSVEEIADLRAVKEGAATALYASGSFLPRVYRWDAAAKTFRTAYAAKKDFGMVDSLQILPEGLAFVTEEAVGLLPLPAAGSPEASSFKAWDAAMKAYKSARDALPLRLESLAFAGPGGQTVSLSELWLVERRYATPRIETARGKDGLYLVTGFARTKMDFYANLMRERSLNMLTIDMKDDFGQLRFSPRSELLKKMGKVVSPLDIEAFVARMKAQGVYLVARIVVFKDDRLHELEGGKYAVWDARNKKPWRGYFRTAAPPAPSPSAPPTSGIPGAGAASAAPLPSPTPLIEYSHEYWVDPYCEVVWQYNVEIAKEIIARGFDEVQFDYIRFPTDGVNLDDASFRWRDPGMDKESALMSFLSYARNNIDAPISIDIYGANGWYRTGVRTGQDVEMLQRYVDVICPMFYPSHFEQDFYDMHPAEERPWRIYFYGSLRNTYIARYRAIVRPWVQAFYMNVRYDRKYYDKEYIKRQVRGVRESVDMGMTFWNNSGKYEDLPDMASPEVLGGDRLAEQRRSGLMVD